MNSGELVSAHQQISNKKQTKTDEVYALLEAECDDGCLHINRLLSLHIVHAHDCVICASVWKVSSAGFSSDTNRMVGSAQSQVSMRFELLPV